VILGLVCLCTLFLAVSARADEFRAVVVTDQESAALRAAKTRADEALAAFVKLRSAAEERYKSRFNGCCIFDWSDDYRVIVERRIQWGEPSWRISPQSYILTSPAEWPVFNGSDLFSSNAVPERGVNAIDWSAK